VNEQVLADFLRGSVTARELGPVLLAARVSPDSPSLRSSSNYRVTPLLRPVNVTVVDIDRLVASVEAGLLTEEQVGIAAFLLEAGIDRFLWDTDTNDGERVADVLFWLGMPAINYPLTPEILGAMRLYLRTGQYSMGLTPRGAGAPNKRMQPTSASE
jgi:hypothetical protein